MQSPEQLPNKDPHVNQNESSPKEDEATRAARLEEKFGGKGGTHLTKPNDSVGDKVIETDPTKIGHSLTVGSEVYYEGKIWKVFAFSETPGTIKRTEDWETSPYGDIKKNVVSNGQVATIESINQTGTGGNSYLGVDPTQLVQVTPENKAQIEEMINDRKANK